MVFSLTLTDKFEMRCEIVSYFRLSEDVSRKGPDISSVGMESIPAQIIPIDGLA
jgi:hypothetical protein